MFNFNFDNDYLKNAVAQYQAQQGGQNAPGNTRAESATTPIGPRSQNQTTTIKPTATASPSNIGQNSATGGTAALGNIGMPAKDIARGNPTPPAASKPTAPKPAPKPAPQLSLGGAPGAASTGVNNPAPAAAAQTRIAYTGLGGEDYNDMTKLSDQQLYDITFYGPNVSDIHLAGPIIEAAIREQRARNPMPVGGANPGMVQNGTQYLDAQIANTPAPTSQAPTNPLQPSTPSGGQNGGPSSGGGSAGPTDPSGGGTTPGGWNPQNPSVTPGGPTGGTTGVNTGQPVGDSHYGSNPYLDPTTGNPASNDKGQGGTTFNPGQGTNPDGTNPGVPQGNQNNGTAPNVYQTLPQDPTANPVNTRNADGSVQGNYSGDTGNAFQAIASNAAAQSDMNIERSGASTAADNTRTVTGEEMSSQQLNDILSQDSPLMQLARQDGVRQANAVGLRNSSLAAGASMAEMARQATPLAMQQAEANLKAQSQNQVLESDRRQFNAGQTQQNDQFNAQNENAAESQEFGTEAQRRDANASRETQVASTNAAMANETQQSDRNREFQYAMQQLSGDVDYAKNQLAADRAIDMANIEGQYNLLISDNAAASSMVQSTYDAIADVISNPEIFGDEASEKVNFLVGNLTDMLDGLLAFDSLDLQLAGSTGSGERSSFRGSGGTTGSGNLGGNITTNPDGGRDITLPDGRVVTIPPGGFGGFGITAP